MIRVTRAMLRSRPSSTVSTFKKIHSQNVEMLLFLKKLEKQIKEGANTMQIFCEIEDKLREFETFEIDWPS